MSSPGLLHERLDRDRRITNHGTAFEYHDEAKQRGGWFELGESDPWTWPLATHGQSVVKARARAGQGVAPYVLLSDNSLNVWHDSGSTWDSQINLGTPISAIDAGTDRYGVNKLDVLFKAGFVSEWDGMPSTCWPRAASRSVPASGATPPS